MQSILDVPMAAVYLEEPVGRRLLRRQVGDEVEDFVGGLPLAGDGAHHLSYLLQMRTAETEIGSQLCTDLDLAHFDATPSSLRRRGLHILSERVGEIGLQVRP